MLAWQYLRHVTPLPSNVEVSSNTSIIAFCVNITACIRQYFRMSLAGEHGALGCSARGRHCQRPVKCYRYRSSYIFPQDCIDHNSLLQPLPLLSAYDGIYVGASGLISCRRCLYKRYLSTYARIFHSTSDSAATWRAHWSLPEVQW